VFDYLTYVALAPSGSVNRNLEWEHPWAIRKLLELRRR
jgi:hypothetical protein